MHPRRAVSVAWHKLGVFALSLLGEVAAQAVYVREVGVACDGRKRVIPSHLQYGCGEVTLVAFKAEQRTTQRVTALRTHRGLVGARIAMQRRVEAMESMPSGVDRTVEVVDQGIAPSSVAEALAPLALRAVPAFLFSPPPPSSLLG
jgi:hypothetical protein